jgi:hypothetical protein
VRPTPLAPQPRRRALADLDTRIACAEAIRSRYVQDLKAFPGARRRTQALLRIAIAEARADRLRRSRETLLSRQPGAE